MNISIANDKMLKKYMKRNPNNVKTGWIKSMLKKRKRSLKNE